MSIPFIEENDQTLARREHLEALQQLVGNAYPNKFERSRVVNPEREDTISAVVEKFRDLQSSKEPPEELNQFVVRIAGRIATPPRVMGKAAFVHLSDGVSRLQIYIRKADVAGVHNGAEGGEVDGWALFQLVDHGDFIGVEGYLFVTKTGELSVHVQKLQFLSKALLPLPDKMHGIHDPEIRQRQRYADLIAGSLKLEQDEALTPREVFERRAAAVRDMRRILEDHGYIEVETPMLTPLATGAAARPFKTHHNALDIDLYARIAPELYLKRLLVGGFEKVYELNRNFRNEGISTRHNPEFTMLEFYCAYMDVNGMMDFCEELVRDSVKVVTGSSVISYKQYGPGLKDDELVVYNEHKFDFSRHFERLTMKQAIIKHWEQSHLGELLDEKIDENWLNEPRKVRMLIKLNQWWSTRGWFSYLRPYPEFPSDEELEKRLRVNVANQWQAIKEDEAKDLLEDLQIEWHIVHLFESIAESHTS